MNIYFPSLAPQPTALVALPAGLGQLPASLGQLPAVLGQLPERLVPRNAAFYLRNYPP